MKKRMPIGNYSWDHLCALVGINVQCRAEELDVNQWIELARLLDDNPFKDIPQKDSEIFDVVNSNDQVIKQMDRLTIHREGLLHRAVHVFVFNRFGELFCRKDQFLKIVLQDYGILVVQVIWIQMKIMIQLLFGN